MKQNGPLANLSTLMAVFSVGAGIYGLIQDTQPKPTPPEASPTIVYTYVVVPGEPTPQPTPQPTRSVENLKWQVAGSPTTTAAKIEEELVKYNSPMKGLGKFIYNQGVTYGVDPNFFMAINFLESVYATKMPSIAVNNHNPGSLRNSLGGTPKTVNGFAYFDSWQKGITAFFKHMSTFYFQEKQLLTVDDILPVYAPKKENNTAKYIADTKRRMDTLRTPPSQ